MDAKEVIEKILSDAENEAAKIKQQTETELAEDKKALDSRLSEYNKKTEELAQKQTEETKEQVLAAARMQIKKQILAEKRKILDEVFAEAKDKLCNLPEQDYRKLMTKLCLDAVQSGDEEVIVDKNEKIIDANFLSEINRQLGDSKGNLKLASEKQSIGGGFILKRGKIKNNVSADVLLDEARKELEGKLAGELFN